MLTAEGNNVIRFTDNIRLTIPGGITIDINKVLSWAITKKNYSK